MVAIERGPMDCQIDSEMDGCSVATGGWASTPASSAMAAGADAEAGVDPPAASGTNGSGVVAGGRSVPAAAATTAAGSAAGTGTGAPGSVDVSSWSGEPPLAGRLSSAGGAFAPFCCASRLTDGTAEGCGLSVRGLGGVSAATSTMAGSTVAAASTPAALLAAALRLVARLLAVRVPAAALRAVVLGRRGGLAGVGATASARLRSSVQFAHALVPAGIHVSQTNREQVAQNR